MMVTKHRSLKSCLQESMKKAAKELFSRNSFFTPLRPVQKDNKEWRKIKKERMTNPRAFVILSACRNGA